MFSTIFSLLTIIFIIISVIITTRSLKKSISWRLKQGLNCYSCKEEIKLAHYIHIDQAEKLELCKSCERDSKLDSLLNNKYKLIQFKKFLLSSKSDKLMKLLIFILILVVIADIILYVIFKIKGVSIIGNGINIIFWILTLLKSKWSNEK